MQNGRLNTQQRQALVKLVQNAYNRRIEKQCESCNDAVARITSEVKTQLGIDKMDEAIKEHERMLKDLEAEKEHLGFSKYNGNLIPGSQAKKLVEERSGSERQKVTDLESEMDRTISAIWTATELSEVKSMVDEVLAEA